MLCSKDNTTKVNIGINITIIFSVIVLANVDKYTADVTRKLHSIPKIMASIKVYDNLVLAIFIKDSLILSFNGVLYTKKVIINIPIKFPR